MRRIGVILGWLAALALLHLASIAPLPFAGADPGRALWHVSPDAVCLLAIAALGASIGRGRLFAHLAALTLLAAALYRTAAFYVAALLDRRLDLTFDVMEVPGVLHLLTHDSRLEPWMVVAGAVLALVLAWLLLAWAFARAARPARSTHGAVLLVALLQAIVLGDIARGSLDRRAESWWRPSSVLPLATDVRASASYWFDPGEFDGAIREQLREAAERMAATPTDLGVLHGADVHLVIVESYGRWALREPTVHARLRSLWQQVGPELQAAGFEVCTATCRPSNSGGESWLTHAQLLSAAPIGHRRQFQLLLQSDIEPLPKRFQAAGYHTVEVMPAMPRHWPEGQRFYGFDASITQLELDYTGTVYHWGRMPDQFALHHLLEHVVRPAPGPLFTMYVSVTSHVPFRLVPPYIDDWRIDADTFRGPPRIEHPLSWSSVPFDPQLVPAYADTLEYTLRCTAGFVARLTRPSLVIVLGDHQPPIATVGPTRDAGYDVPIHAFANRPELLAPCRALGFVDGYEVPEGAEAFPTDRFAPAFLELYSQPSQQPR
ncbi:MAG: sulfatase-like hydrolase/transferase [Planctomycetes bacterium]|nr:sulfatase-like hydrolase/transferase [Planctomycetota bacterium]